MDAHKTPDAVREAVQKGLEFVAVTLAFLGRDRGTDRESKTLDGLAIEARALDPIMREALAALDSLTVATGLVFSGAGSLQALQRSRRN